MTSTRQERIKELLKIEISDILRRELRDPRLGFITITDAEVSPDLKVAKVFFSVMGTEEQKRESMKGLKSATRFIRGEFGKRVRMKTVPEIEFRFDTAIEQGARIFELLQQIKHEEDEQ